MKYPAVLCLILASVTSLVHGQTTIDQCNSCDVTTCAPAVNCAAGVTVDPCGCCFVCGRLEGEKCDNYTLPLAQKNQYGFCGENLACLLRTDTSSTVNEYHDYWSYLSCTRPVESIGGVFEFLRGYFRFFEVDGLICWLTSSWYMNRLSLEYSYRFLLQFPDVMMTHLNSDWPFFHGAADFQQWLIWCWYSVSSCRYGR